MKDSELRRAFLRRFYTEQDIQAFCHDRDLPYRHIQSWIQRRSELKSDAIRTAILHYVKGGESHAVRHEEEQAEAKAQVS